MAPSSVCRMWRSTGFTADRVCVFVCDTRVRLAPFIILLWIFFFFFHYKNSPGGYCLALFRFKPFARIYPVLGLAVRVERLFFFF